MRFVICLSCERWMWSLCRNQMELNYRRHILAALILETRTPRVPGMQEFGSRSGFGRYNKRNPPTPPTPPNRYSFPIVFGLTTWSQYGRRVGVLSYGMWRIVFTAVSSWSPERQVAHRTQSSLSLPWESKISYSHYSDRATRLYIFNTIGLISEWLRLQQFRLEGLAFKE